MKRLLLLPCLLPALADAQIDRTRGGASDEAAFDTRYVLQSADPANLRWVADPAGSRRTVLRATVRASDPKVFGGHRTEIVPLKEYAREGVRWYAISAYVPADWKNHPYPAIIGQLHTSQKKALVPPPLAFVIHDDKLDLELYASHRVPDEEGVDRNNAARQRLRLDRLQKAHWYCFVVRADWSAHPGSGSLKVWMNGDLVYETANQYNAYDTWLGNYPKAGLYMPGMMGVNERMVYLDFIHVGGPRTGVDEMYALTPCAGDTAKGKP